MSKKGTIPIETIVILVIALIVLVVLIAFFMGVIGPSGLRIQREREFYDACTQWTAANCGVAFPSTLQDKCKLWQNIPEDVDPGDDDVCGINWIKSACQCPAD